MFGGTYILHEFSSVDYFLSHFILQSANKPYITEPFSKKWTPIRDYIWMEWKWYNKLDIKLGADYNTSTYFIIPTA
jgi:hypothetical protein